jgi:hypothetical protein
MPHTMAALQQEYVITPETTYILNDIDFIEIRRVFTDGRTGPRTSSRPTWVIRSADGSTRTATVAMTCLRSTPVVRSRGPRAYDHTGLPLHSDNQSTFKERFHVDKSDPNILHDEITVFDHALTRPWSVDKTFVRNPDPRPNWPESNCNENNANIVIGKENYFMSPVGLLLPAMKDQAGPDLRYF